MFSFRRGVLLALALTGVMLMAGCGPAAKPPTTPTTDPVVEAKRPELTPPFEAALTALKAMNASAKTRDWVATKTEFTKFRAEWETIRKVLREEDPRLEQHIEDGAVELDHEFTKPPLEIRVYEFDEETVKLGRLLSDAAELLGTPIREDLVQRDPTEEIPYNQEKRIEVSLVDHRIEPAVIELEQHTKVTFVVTNRGRDIHEFMVGYYALEVEDLKPGETKELTFVTIDAGEFETACHYPGHYEVGMFGKMIVKPADLKKQ